MRPTPRALTTTALIAALTVLAGCSSDGSTPSTTTTAPATSVSPTASPTPTPTTRREKAAASAEAVFRQYVLTLDQVAKSGGTAPDALKDVAISTELINAQQTAVLYRKNGWRGVGQTIVKSTKVASVSFKTDPKKNVVPEVIVKSCLDATNGYAVDENGKKVRAADAPVFFEETAWVRYYPKFPGGVDHWFVGRVENKGVKSC